MTHQGGSLPFLQKPKNSNFLIRSMIEIMDTDNNVTTTIPDEIENASASAPDAIENAPTPTSAPVSDPVEPVENVSGSADFVFPSASAEPATAPAPQQPIQNKKKKSKAIPVIIAIVAVLVVAVGVAAAFIFGGNIEKKVVGNWIIASNTIYNNGGYSIICLNGDKSFYLYDYYPQQNLLIDSIFTKGCQWSIEDSKKVVLNFPAIQRKLEFKYNASKKTFAGDGTKEYEKWTENINDFEIIHEYIFDYYDGTEFPTLDSFSSKTSVYEDKIDSDRITIYSYETTQDEIDKYITYLTVKGYEFEEDTDDGHHILKYTTDDMIFSINLNTIEKGYALVGMITK